MTDPYYTVGLDGGVVWTEAGLIRTFAEKAATVLLDKEDTPTNVSRWNDLALKLERRITEVIEEES